MKCGKEEGGGRETEGGGGEEGNLKRKDKMTGKKLQKGGLDVKKREEQVEKGRE